MQVMEMDTRSPDGSTHTTRSVRICLPHDEIVYRQTVTPEVMAAHTGRWTLRQAGREVEATAQHTVVIRTEAVPAALGPGGTVDRARELTRKALGTNSLRTQRHTKSEAEGDS